MSNGRSRVVEALDRILVALPLVVLYFFAAVSCYYALALSPMGIWDKGVMTAVEVASLMTMGLAALAWGTARVVCIRRAWCWPAGALLLVGAARWIYAATVWP